MTIHKEGRLLLLVLAVLFLALNFGASYYYPQASLLQNIVLISTIIFFLIVLQFFRSPKIITHANEKLVIAPADGKVVVIEEVLEKEYFNSKRKQISIFMSPVNVHVNRSPVSGIVKYFKYHAGKYLVAWHPKSSTENERTTMVLDLGNGLEVLVRQIAGALARRIKWYVDEGTQIKQGNEFGFIKFGSRVDVFLPIDAEVRVNIGDKTKGGRTILAELP
ncbi:phosphatidylserine decarboxylase family protein [Reichenbachiella sp. MALMAid0571]|uniref:phosphatidylserine decarboxylase family protein n=1 Tax=Reichenbachiella sp. MALMAid0571 TaxID=3143939 RepID=UPI0032DF4165